MIVLGIETTCDETAAAVVERSEDGRGKILSNIVLSQVSEHAAFGGVVPEIAARAHVEALDLVIAKAMAQAGCGFDRIDGVAAAAGPGLIGGVIVGLTTAKAIALVQAQAADRGQSSRSPRAHRAADRRHAVSLLPVPRLRRPHPDRRRARRRRLCAARHHAGRRHRRGLRQDRQAARPRLSGRAAGREGSGARRRRPLRAAAADARAQGRRFLALRFEDRAAAGSRKDRAAVRPGRRRSVRLVPAGGGRRRARPAARRLAPVPRATTARRPRWSPPAASPPTRRSARCCTASPSRSAPRWWRRRSNCAPTTAP